MTERRTGHTLQHDLVGLGLDAARAAGLADAVESARDALPPPACWQRLCRSVLDHAVPFAAHERVHAYVFADWDEARDGPTPDWTPADEEIERTHLADWMRRRGCASYHALHSWSVADREGFWSAVLEALEVRFRRRPERVLDLSAGAEHPRWLPGARLNVAESCFGAPDDALALVAGAPGRETERLTTAELRRNARRVARALVAAGFRRGDALALDMPMGARAVELYLGIVLAGMVVVSIPDALAPEEVATRLRIAKAAGLFTAHAIARGEKHLPLYEKLLKANPPRTVVLGAGDATLRAGDERWEDFLARAGDSAGFEAAECDPDDTLNVLFSSGTTGEPKAIPWTHLTPIKAAADAHLHFDLHPGEVLAWPTNLGWMMGPWLIFAGLMNRATIALFEDAPTTRAFGEFVAAERVNVLGLVPSIVKAWRADDRLLGLDLSSIRCFGSTGEASNPSDYRYLMMLAGHKPVIEYCGGTELGGGYLTGTLVQPASASTFTTPALGSDLVLLDEKGRPSDRGEVFLVPPSLGDSRRLLNRDHHEVYFEGTPAGPNGELLRRHGDQLERLPGGFFRAHGRVDDTMNLGGIKTSSAELERVLDDVEGVTRTAAIAVPPPGGGPDRLVVYAVTGGAAPEDLHARLQDALKQHLNPLFRVHEVVVVDTLPVTASNKVMRRELRARHAARS